jgi:hypothetical protein
MCAHAVRWAALKAEKMDSATVCTLRPSVAMVKSARDS